MVFSLFLIGFIALSSQIVILRELLIVFYGNEITLGIILGGWLVTGAFGSFIAGRFIKRIKDELFFYNLLQVILSVYLVFVFYLIRKIPQVLGISVGEITSEIPVIFTSFLLVLPINGVLGALFSVGTQIYKYQGKDYIPIGYVYILESIGAFLGGIVTSFVFLPLFDSLKILTILSALNIIATVFLSQRKVFKVVSVLVLFSFFYIFPNSDFINKSLIESIYPEYELVFFKNSYFQSIMVLKREEGVSLFTDGIYNFTYPDPFPHEMLCHVSMVQSFSPKRVLLIGGGLSEIVKEILKYPVEELVYLEIDPVIVNEVRRFFPVSEDKRFKIVISDARYYLKKTEKKFDVVILQLPPPHTLLLNRFYTFEFFSLIKKHLNENGILSFSFPSQPNYLSSELKLFFLSIKKTLLKVFPEVLITPGDTAYFIASKNKGVLIKDWRVMMERIRERKVKTIYFREYYLFGIFSPFRFKILEESLSEFKGRIRINKDFNPISFYYNSILWATQFQYELFRDFLKKLDFRKILVAFILFLLIFLHPCFFKKEAYSYRILAVISSTGFAEISFQIITLLSFQILYGKIFWKMGLIFTSFMFGLIFGSILITYLEKRREPGYSLFLITQIFIVIYPLVLLLFLKFFEKGFYGYAILPLLPFIPGFIGGFQFPLSVALYYKRKKKKRAEVAGIFYSADLIGSFLGSFVLSLIIIPVCGIYPAIFFVFILNLAGLFLLLTKPSGN
ncbi:MAG: hypothetical protein DRI36_00740 [Caldiserica bacterium]|nr:MAG: hypothetical protein DRI36_00740 [Caldisericota bacterium]